MGTKKQDNHWKSKENCRIEALKYKSRNEFNKNSSGAYNNSWSNGWLDELCSHMVRQGSRYSRCIYSCNFSDNSIYIGITYSFNRRKTAHLNIEGKKISSVGNYIIKTGIIPEVIKLTDYLPLDEAVILEERYVNEYREKGWNILNRIKTGGVGSNLVKWDKAACKKEALKYKSRNEFMNKSSGAYCAANNHKFLNEITEHMLKYRKHRGYWTKERCLDVAKTCKTRTEFLQNFGNAYAAAVKNGAIVEIHEMLKTQFKPSGYWNKEKCLNEFLKFKTIKELKLNTASAYSAAQRNGWLDECTAHMEKNKPNGYWNFNVCKIEAIKYARRVDFRYGSTAAYCAAQKNGWLDELCFHMLTKKRKPSGYWTKENCRIEALKYKSRGGFSRHSNGAYDKSLNNNWLDEFYSNK